MTLRPIRTRADLIHVAHERCGHPAIKRAIKEGTVVNLGGFTAIPTSGQPGWVLRVTSTHGRTWLLAITVEGRHYRASVLDAVPPTRSGGEGVYAGDAGKETE